jgi:hypothetical protein
MLTTADVIAPAPAAAGAAFAVHAALLQAVVFGVSCYFDVQDMMEKRVRSRFSNRKVFLNGFCAAQQVSRMCVYVVVVVGGGVTVLYLLACHF